MITLAVSADKNKATYAIYFPHVIDIKYCIGHEYQLWKYPLMIIPEKEGWIRLKFKNIENQRNYCVR